MFLRNQKSGRINFGDPAMGQNSAVGYLSAVDEVARLRATYADRDPHSQFYASHIGDLEDNDFQVGVARSLSDGPQAGAGHLEYGSGRPRGVVDIFRAVAHSLAGTGAGGNDVPALR